MTRPTFPIACWFQPVRNIPAMVALGVNTFFGAEVENSKGMAPDVLAAQSAAWVKAVSAAGAYVVLKLPPAGPLPDNCIGLFLSIDEPNGKGIGPAAIKAESDDLRARYPGVPLVLSLAGDKVTSANFKKADQVQLYKDYAALADILTVDAYSKNRNAVRYPTTWTGDAVKTLIAVTGKEVWAWIEANDQQLPAPTTPPDTNRAPTPDEIKATVDYAVQQGAKGIGWFLTSDSGKYGWPQSFFPQVDRAGASMQPQYDMVRQVSTTLSPPTPAPAPQPPSPADPVAALRTRIDGLADLIGQAVAKSAQASNDVTALRAALAAALKAP
jgi:hypothetical protein